MSKSVIWVSAAKNRLVRILIVSYWPSLSFGDLAEITLEMKIRRDFGLLSKFALHTLIPTFALSDPLPHVVVSFLELTL